MENQPWLESYFEEILNNLHFEHVYKQFYQIKEIVLKVKKNKNKIFFIGNGASNIIASHATLDYTSQLNIKCHSMNTPSFITAFANDFGYQNTAKRYLQFYSNKNDLVFLISSSGESLNMINAGLETKKLGCDLITLTGFAINNTLTKMGEINLWADSKQYNIVEGIHNLWLSTICDFIAKDFKIGKHGYEFEK